MRKFQKDFMLGAATAAHQVEGNNIHSDYWAQEQIPHSNFAEPSLDAVDHYNRYEEDIRLLAEAGLNTYRFSIEWARIQPEEDLWVEEEVAHYRKVLECCHSHHIRPVVTLHHFSSPKWLITKGGWENPEVTELFAAYCKRIVLELGSLMEYVCTINEANMRLQLAALIKDMMRRMAAPGASIKDMEGNVQVGVNMMPENIRLTLEETAAAFGIEDPMKVHTFVSQCTLQGDYLVMKAHEAARDAMKEACPHLQIGLTLSLHDLQALEGGEAAVEKEWEDEFLHYLPFIREDDFLGVQCYSRKILDRDGNPQMAEGAIRTQMGYEDYPVAIANVIRKVAEDFHGTILVTENGIATDDDKRRCEFITEAVDAIQGCIEDRIPVKGYMYWSLLDNFEWQKGYCMTFGLISVDRSTQIRTAKDSLYLLGTMHQEV